jgi:DNA-binding CsgD family transcriptional regulator
LRTSVLSMEKRPHGQVRVLAFKRVWGDRPYAEEERELVDLAHSECAWLLDGPKVANASMACEWSPREKETLDLLLTGASEKSVASSLSLSPHTVHDYVKAIYKKLGVASRAELMARAIAKPATTR